LKLAHSHSAIAMFEQCPKRYYHQKVVKDAKDEGGIASDYGNRVHKQFELRLKDGTPLPIETVDYEGMVASIERTAARINATLLVEDEICLNNKLRVVDWWAEDAWLRAKLDVLIIKDDYAMIFDWKTGKRKVDFSQLFLAGVMALFKYPELMSVRTGFVWLKDKKLDQDPERIERRDMVAHLHKLFPRIKRIEQALETNNWPARPSGLCAYCPARDMCEFARLRK
jgi:hypothetical protein